MTPTGRRMLAEARQLAREADEIVSAVEADERSHGENDTAAQLATASAHLNRASALVAKAITQ